MMNTREYLGTTFTCEYLDEKLNREFPYLKKLILHFIPDAEFKIGKDITDYPGDPCLVIVCKFGDGDAIALDGISDVREMLCDMFDITPFSTRLEVENLSGWISYYASEIERGIPERMVKIYNRKIEILKGRLRNALDNMIII